MKKKILPLLLITVMALTACSSGPGVETEDTFGGDAVENEADTGDGASVGYTSLFVPASEKQATASLPDLELSGKLTLAVCWDYYYIEDAVQRFQDLHPGVEIEMEHYHSDYEKYASNIDAQLMSRMAPDVVDGGGLDFLKYSRSGALADFVPLMNNDARFYPEDYYQNALEAMVFNGGIYSFPINFSYDLISINSAVGETAVAGFTGKNLVTMMDLMALYEEYGAEKGFFLCYNLDAAIAASYAMNDFIDLNAKTASINSPEFIQMIDSADKGTDPEKYIGGTMRSNFYGLSFDEQSAESNLYRMASPDSMEYFMPFERELGNHYYSDLVPVGYKSGNVKIESVKSFYIGENSENKELAWEFIKFLTTLEGAEGVWQPSTPIKRDVAEKHLREQMEMVVNGFYDAEYPERFTLTEEIIQEALQKANDFNERPMEMILHLADNVYEEAEYLHNGTKTAEQVAETLQNKVSLFLME